MTSGRWPPIRRCSSSSDDPGSAGGSVVHTQVSHPEGSLIEPKSPAHQESVPTLFSIERQESTAHPTPQPDRHSAISVERFVEAKSRHSITFYDWDWDWDPGGGGIGMHLLDQRNLSSTTASHPPSNDRRTSSSSLGLRTHECESLRLLRGVRQRLERPQRGPRRQPLEVPDVSPRNRSTASAHRDVWPSH
jgi:hypothetical protein